VTSKYLSAILVIALSLALSVPAQAQNPSIGVAPIGNNKEPFKGAIIGVFAAVAGVAVISTILIVHYSKKRSVTGCVNSGTGALTLTEEGNNRTYLLSGNTVGLTPGDRMKLHGRKAKSNGPDKTLVWDTEKVSKDYGVCKVGGNS
jgi:hypothetical protein